MSSLSFFEQQSLQGHSACPWLCHLHRVEEVSLGRVYSVTLWCLWLDLSVPFSFSLAGPGAPAWGPAPLTSAGPCSPGKLNM